MYTSCVVDGFKSRYTIYCDGKLQNNETGRFLKPRLNSHGYFSYSLQLNGFIKQMYAHRLVAQYFVPGESDGYEVNHINGIKTDNYFGNLEWLSKKDHTKFTISSGQMNLVGENNNMATISNDKALEIVKLLKETEYNNKDISILTGVKTHIVASINHGTSFKHLSGGSKIRKKMIQYKGSKLNNLKK